MAYEEPQWTAWKDYLDSLFSAGGAGYAVISGQLLAIGVDPSERTVRRLFWRDDMENYTVCKWRPDAGEVIAYVKDEPAYGAFEGDYCLRVSNPTDTYQSARVRFGRLPDGKVTLEARWWKDAYINIMRFAIDLYDSLKGYCTVGHLQWDRLDERWKYSYPDHLTQVNIPGGGGTDFPLGREPIEDDTWNHVRVTFDYLNNRYSRLGSNGKVIDLSGFNLPLYTFASARPSCTDIILVPMMTAVNRPAYFDDVRIYINEV